ncbi:MAG: dTDP-4-dehydrorhamnose 3,5-epimerase family protein [Patescibacteria group bacterium]|nr:dTDP-4-dehydrorhamnose 3,5-epimerase family protein [Patescibacteria group bacterium]MDE2015259.1 dTDP-4-dehydrorhamnose 3,5-epimerase family protein [Patescibacteria group bacterium]MDE2227065.1 dTDP-4-dehydrorhamnose 3,5-epimerase family protein [Patescibacteria group bacterium]
MDLRESKIGGACEIFLKPSTDERGHFMRTYDSKIFEEYGLPTEWPEESESFSRIKGTIRGLHFQYPPDWETKVIRAVSGETFLAIVDLRKTSPTFGKWDSVVLSATKHNMFVVPRGCANGICTLTENCILAYKMDNHFNPKNQDNILWKDSDIGIDWPINPPVIISARDTSAQTFKQFMKKSKRGL